MAGHTIRSFLVRRISPPNYPPRDDIPNARLISKSLTGVTVEFDANEPETKVYFSLAHGIGQVLFPDFGLTLQNRIKMSKRDFSDQAQKFRAMIYE